MLHHIPAQTEGRGSGCCSSNFREEKPGRKNSIIPALLLFVALPRTGPWSSIIVILGFEQLFLYSCSDFNYPSFPSAIVQHLTVRGLFCQQNLKCPMEMKENLAWILPSHSPVCSFLGILAEQALPRLLLHLVNIIYDTSVNENLSVPWISLKFAL